MLIILTIKYYYIVIGITLIKLALKHILALFAELGIPVSMSKLEGPSTVMVFLGILFDTISMTIRKTSTYMTLTQVKCVIDWQVALKRVSHAINHR